MSRFNEIADQVGCLSAMLPFPGKFFHGKLLTTFSGSVNFITALDY
jgi:hypothetical protein